MEKGGREGVRTAVKGFMLVRGLDLDWPPELGPTDQTNVEFNHSCGTVVGCREPGSQLTKL